LVSSWRNNCALFALDERPVLLELPVVPEDETVLSDMPLAALVLALEPIVPRALSPLAVMEPATDDAVNSLNESRPSWSVSIAENCVIHGFEPVRALPRESTALEAGVFVEVGSYG